jgi:hypothetical protein
VNGAVGRASLPAALLSLLLSPLLACEPSAPEAPPKPPSVAVRVTNLANGETLRHSLVIIDGVAGGTSIATATLGDDASKRLWPVVDGRFRALVPLRKGRNEVKLNASDGGRGDLVVSHLPDDNRYFVRPLYVVPADDEGTFDAEGGEGRDVASAQARISTAMWLMQAFTAEAMYDAGFGRRAFRLPLDDKGMPIVEVHKSSLTMAQAQAMDGNALWQHLARELSTSAARDVTIDAAVMSMTRYDGATRKVSAHAAHGGERLALFGSGTLHTFAPDLDRVVEALGDDRVLDASAFFDDSGNRGTHWAAYATGMGAMLHELGHCFGLAHAKEGVMSRAFDHVNRKLVIAEPASTSAIAESSEVGFDRSAAVRMRYLPYFTREPHRSGPASLKVSIEGGSVVVESSAPIRHVQVELDTMGVEHQEHLDASAPKRVVLNVAQLRARHGKGVMKVSAVDDEGMSAIVALP